MSNSLQPHGLYHARLLTSLSPRVCSNLCPLSWWYYLTILSSTTPFSFCLQSFPASRSFLMSQLFISGGQRFGASGSALPMNIEGWFPLGLMAGSPCSLSDSQESSPTRQFRSIHSSALSLLYGPSSSHIHMWVQKNHSFDFLLAKWRLSFLTPCLGLS